MLRRGVISVVATSSDIEVIGEAANGAEALKLVDECLPDVLLLDLRMPEVGGLEVLRRLQERQSTCRVIVLSMEERSVAEPIALDKGAWGYVEKDSDPYTLLDMIREVASHPGREATPSPLAVADLPKQASLSSRQLQVLELLVEGRTNHEIAGELWISERTVKHHVAGILSYFGVQRRSQAVAKATGRHNAPDKGETPGS